MVIDGRSETITINVHNIDQFSENEENGRLVLVYHMPAEPTAFNRNAEGMVKRKDEFECAENELLLKTFKGIRNKLVGTASDPETAMFGAAQVKQPSATPTSQRRVSLM